MGISDKKTRTGITIDKVLKLKVEYAGGLENRTFNNMLVIAVTEYIEKYKEELKLKEHEFTYEAYNEKYEKLNKDKKKKSKED